MKKANSEITVYEFQQYVNSHFAQVKGKTIKGDRYKTAEDSVDEITKAIEFPEGFGSGYYYRCIGFWYQERFYSLLRLRINWDWYKFIFWNTDRVKGIKKVWFELEDGVQGDMCLSDWVEQQKRQILFDRIKFNRDRIEKTEGYVKDCQEDLIELQEDLKDYNEQWESDVSELAKLKTA